MANQERKEQARLLRSQGLALGEIAYRVQASKSVVSRWVRDIALTDEQRAALKSDRPGRFRGTEGLKKKYRELRKQHQDTGRQFALTEDWHHAAACMLYWAEGKKARNLVSINNSDPHLLRFFLEFLREYFQISDSDVAIRVQCYLNNGLTLEEIENWWLETLNLPRTCLRRSSSRIPISRRLDRAPKANLSYGTCEISIGRTDIVQHIYGAIQEYAQFESEDWLD